MALTKEEKSQIILEYGKDEKNTGSIETQVALLTGRITYLTEHFKTHKKDTNSRRGLLKLVGQRRKLLKYLQRTDLEGYRALVQKLQIRK
ncbi:MAG: 30S ribosomal protein S15 [Spirochaetia bacterium]|nr:30S ribosomal protein S15 [Spirochaetia bacterium]